MIYRPAWLDGDVMIGIHDEDPHLTAYLTWLLAEMAAELRRHAVANSWAEELLRRFGAGPDDPTNERTDRRPSEEPNGLASAPSGPQGDDMTDHAASLPEPRTIEQIRAAGAAWVTESELERLCDRIAELEASWSTDMNAGIEWQSRAHTAQSRIDQLQRDLAAIEEWCNNAYENEARAALGTVRDMVRAAKRGDTP